MRTAKNPVVHLNRGSPMRGRTFGAARRNGKPGSLGDRGVAELSPASVDPISASSWTRFSVDRLLASAKRLALIADRIDLLLGLGNYFGRQWSVKKGPRHLLTIVSCP